MNGSQDLARPKLLELFQDESRVVRLVVGRVGLSGVIEYETKLAAGREFLLG